MNPIGSTDAWVGGRVTTRATAILAPNPSLMTLDGTNTWLLHEPGSNRLVVVDPGPENDGHLSAIVRTADGLGAEVASILLTHGHADHSEGAAALHDLTGAPVKALDPRHRLGSEGLADGDVLSVGGLEIQVLATPGHTSDSLSFALPTDRALLTGDTILGRGTSVIAHPDGHLGSYLSSLQRLAELSQEQGSEWVLPGHGPACPRPSELISVYQGHRRERLGRVAAARESGVRTIAELLRVCYPEIPESLHSAAGLSLAAQLEHLDEAPK